MVWREDNIGTCATSGAGKDIVFLANQSANTTYNTNGINGVTSYATSGITFTDAATDLINCNIAGGSVSHKLVYACFQYWLTTAVGIANDFTDIQAPDPANYIYTNMKYKNTSTGPVVPLSVVDGWGRDATTELSITLWDSSGGPIGFSGDHAVAYSSGSGLDPTQAAQLTDTKNAVTSGAHGNAALKILIDAITGVVSQGVPHYYYPTTATRVVGDNDGGVTADMSAHDEVYYDTGEVSGTGLQVVLDFTGITAGHIPATLAIAGYYDGGGTHDVGVSVWNYTTSAWESKLTMVTRSSAFDYDCGLTADNVNGSGQASVRFLHSAGTYIAAHVLRLDQVQFSAVEATNQDSASIAAIKALLEDGSYGQIATKTAVDVIPTSPLLAADYTAPPSAETTAAAVLSAATTTPIYADSRKVNGTTLKGDGTVADKFRSTLIA